MLCNPKFLLPCMSGENCSPEDRTSEAPLLHPSPLRCSLHRQAEESTPHQPFDATAAQLPHPKLKDPHSGRMHACFSITTQGRELSSGQKPHTMCFFCCLWTSGTTMSPLCSEVCFVHVLTGLLGANSSTLLVATVKLCRCVHEQYTSFLSINRLMDGG